MTQTIGKKMKEFAKAIDLKRIIVIDDDFENLESNGKLNAATNAFSNLKDQQIESLRVVDEEYGLGLFGADEELYGVDTCREVLRQKWPCLGEDGEAALLSMLDISDTHDSTNDALDQVKCKFEGVVSVRPMAVSQWLHDKVEILNEREADAGLTLIFFDRNLKYVDRELLPGPSGKAGDDLAREVMEFENPSILSGVLTNELRSKDDEIRALDDMFGNGVFVPVLRKEITKKAEDFYQGLLRVVALNALNEIRRIVFEEYENVTSAQELFNRNMSLRNMVGMAQISEREGVHISDALKRIFASYHTALSDAAIRRRCAESPKAQLLLSLDQSKLSSVLNFSAVDSQATAIAYDEAYVDGDVLARGCYPTSIGDVYAANGSFYLLLSQMCGLMVRSNGRRAGGSAHFSLVRLVYGKPDSRQKESGRACCDIPDVHPLGSHEDEGRAGGEAHWYIDFKDRLEIKPEILDLCVFGKNGCSGSIKKEVPRILLEGGWRKYHEALHAWVSEGLQKYERLCTSLAKDESEEKEEAKNAFMMSAFGIEGGRPLVSMIDGIFSFGIQRVARLKEQYSQGVLIQYARYQSRPAYPSPLVTSEYSVEEGK